MYKFLQKLGKSLMLPVAALPICGILMGLGYALAPGAMGVPGAPTEGAAYIVGFLLIKAGGALIDNMHWLFVIGVAVGMADDKDGTSALAGLVSFLMMKSLLAPAVVTTIMPSINNDPVKLLAFQKFENVFPAIIAGLIGATCYNKFKNTQLPNWLAFFSGKRCVAIVTGLVSIGASVILLFVWPVIFGALYAVGEAILGLDIVGVGIGDLQHFWAGDVMGQNGVTWSVGMYMAGFFPCMMFGIAGAAVAMVRAAKNKKVAIGIVTSAAICAFICGVTEPFEFSFMFLAFPLYVVYALLYAIFAMITVALGFRAGFCFSAGATDLIFSASLPAAANTWVILPMGIAAFVVFYLVFYFAIKKWDLKTPGNEDEDAEAEEAKIVLSNNDFTAIASGVLKAIGGKENVSNVDYCTTRLRFEIKDYTAVNEKGIKAAGAAGVIRPSKTACQVIIGPKVQFVYDELKKML